MTSLKELKILFSDVKRLKLPTNLVDLSLHMCEKLDLRFISVLKQLEKLVLKKCYFETSLDVSGLKRLRVVLLSYTRIKGFRVGQLLEALVVQDTRINV